jgi:hypothetical protein
MVRKPALIGVAARIAPIKKLVTFDPFVIHKLLGRRPIVPMYFEGVRIASVDRQRFPLTQRLMGAIQVVR